MKKFVALVLLLIGLLVPAIGVVSAQQSGQGLEISPPLVDQKVDPGQSLQVDIRVRNVTNEAVIAKGQINDFLAEGEEGLPKIITDENAEPSPYSFKEWVTTVPDLSLGPKETKVARITINVPADGSPGGHYGVIRFTAVPVELKDSGVALSASIGTLVLLNVSGDVVEQAEVEQFTVSHNGKSGAFFEYGPLSFTERIKNTGNVHVKPSGTVTIKDTFGKEVAKLAVNDKGGNVLPASIRKFEQNLDRKNLVGRYKAELALDYGDNKTVNSTITFWVVPYKIVAAVLGGLLLLIGLIIFLMKRFKKHVAEEVHHEDAIKYGHEEAPAQHIPGTVHHPENPPQDDNQQSPPQNPINS